MTTSSSGAVFFLGTRAHYQVLQQPESRFDAENGNSTESIYQSPAVDASNNYIGQRNLAYCDNEAYVNEEKEKQIGNGVKRRSKRRQSETALCERDIEMKPALLNHIGENETPKSKSGRRLNLIAFLSSLSRRKRRLDTDQLQHLQHLQHLQTVLTVCTYRESCRCLDCQSRYFDCDESDYSSEESEYADYTPQYVVQEPPPPAEDEDDDEVFIDTPPDDSTSTDMLLESREKINNMSVSSDEDPTLEPGLDIEVAAVKTKWFREFMLHNGYPEKPRNMSVVGVDLDKEGVGVTM